MAAGIVWRLVCPRTRKSCLASCLKVTEEIQTPPLFSTMMADVVGYGSEQLTTEIAKLEGRSAPDVGLTVGAAATAGGQRGLEWSGITFSAGGKDILHGITGRTSHNLTALMGPSGAGKTSLLNILAGRISSKSDAAGSGVRVGGEVRFRGRVIDPVSFSGNIAYVMQDDALKKTQTPREALHFSAALRSGAALGAAARTAKVDALLAELKLEKCADTLIGGALIKGISGGERKRTAIGVELISDPSILFLDEVSQPLLPRVLARDYYPQLTPESTFSVPSSPRLGSTPSPRSASVRRSPTSRRAARPCSAPSTSPPPRYSPPSTTSASLRTVASPTTRRAPAWARTSHATASRARPRTTPRTTSCSCCRSRAGRGLPRSATRGGQIAPPRRRQR